MKKIFFILTMFFHIFSIAEDTPSTYQTSPTWLSQTRKAIKARDFDLAEKLLVENIDQNRTAEWNNLMGYSFRKKIYLISLNPKNIIKQHLKLIPSTKMHWNTMVNYF